MKARSLYFLILSSLTSARYIESEQHQPLPAPPSQTTTQPWPNIELRSPDQALPTAFATQPGDPAPQAPPTEDVPEPTVASVQNDSSGSSNGDDEDGAPPPYTAAVTAAPDQAAALASQGYQQSTYYTCETIAAQAHCGYHIPLYRSGGSSSGVRAGVWRWVPAAATGSWLGEGRKADGGTVVVAVMGLAGVFVVGLM